MSSTVTTPSTVTTRSGIADPGQGADRRPSDDGALPRTAAQVLDAVTSLAPTIAARAREVEDARRVPTDLLEELVATGCFRLILPTTHGGIGGSLPDLVRTVESLAAADASVGWTVMIGAGTWIDLAGLPRPTFDALYAEGPDVMIAGAFSPSGTAVAVDGGYRISGRWGFLSGSPHADWFYGNCMEDLGDGSACLRIALFAPDQVEIEDTWWSMGLKGTGSHHLRADNVVVDADRTWPVMTGEPQLDTPAVRIPAPALFATSISAAAIGVARGALDDIVAIAENRVPLLAAGPLATDITFHRDLAQADADLRAVSSHVHGLAEALWAAATGETGLTMELRAQVRAGAARAVDHAADVVTTALRAGGGPAVYLDHPLQRRFRDIHTMTQHFLVRSSACTQAGGIFVGQPLTVPVF